LPSLYNNLAAVYQGQGNLVAALALVDRANAIYAKSVDHGLQLATMRNGAVLANQLARPDARERIEEALGLAAKRLPPDHPARALLHQTRASIALRARDLATAEADLREADARYGKLGARANRER